MALVNVTSVEVGKNPAGITDPFEFEISFECLQNLQEDLEWKITYISCAESRDMDQELDCIALGPITRGALKFVFHAPSPNFTHIPAEDIHGMAVVLILGSYRNEEFIRIGYYVHNIYIDPILEDNPPDIPIIEKLQRIILSESPRLTRFNISWDSNSQEEIKVDEIPDPQLSNNEDGNSQQFQVSNQTDNSILDNLNCENESSSSNHSKYSDNIANCKATYINEDTNNIVNVSH